MSSSIRIPYRRLGVLCSCVALFPLPFYPPPVALALCHAPPTYLAPNLSQGIVSYSFRMYFSNCTTGPATRSITWLYLSCIVRKS
ncbi:hypothetical protein EXIGLDRAFT_192725 [Exidia glandulosa HHB12029]|uniref:Uncharacterized protein n=1 Tax=Exidia glandulosa HHB12029 TaxID=1314781 RepID=A0A165EX97_EXIGL|nr:hypothetical protein EXIGLDRAFT_192725 [Exidia glandulosa HHB12029]